MKDTKKSLFLLTMFILTHIFLWFNYYVSEAVEKKNTPKINLFSDAGVGHKPETIFSPVCHFPTENTSTTFDPGVLSDPKANCTSLTVFR